MSPLPGTIAIIIYMPEAVSWTDRDVRQWQILLQKSAMGEANCALAPSCHSLR
jgi:hypothetical protein